MTKRIIIIVIALTTALGSMAQTGIYSRDGGRCWEIVTDHSCYILRADGSGLLYPAYWGSRSAADSNVNYTKSGLYEIPVRGLWANKQPLVEVLSSPSRASLAYVCKDSIPMLPTRSREKKKPSQDVT